MPWLLQKKRSQRAQKREPSSIRFNRRHKEFGHVFSGRYKSLIVGGSVTGYLKTVCDYVHLNPVRARLLRPGAFLESYVWSSYGQYLKAPGKRISWLRVDRLLGEWGIPQDSTAGRKRFAKCLEHRRVQEGPKSDWKAVERGWFLGVKSSRRNCWRRCAGGEETTTGQNYGKPTWCMASAFLSGNYGNEAGQKPI